jgi:hypothetical protein
MMADKKVLATSSGIYTVKDGKTVALAQGVEFSIDSTQAEKLARRGKVELVMNKPEPKPKASAKK